MRRIFPYLFLVGGVCAWIVSIVSMWGEWWWPTRFTWLILAITWSVLGVTEANKLRLVTIGELDGHREGRETDNGGAVVVAASRTISKAFAVPPEITGLSITAEETDGAGDTGTTTGESPSPDVDTVPDVAGPIIGYRCWHTTSRLPLLLSNFNAELWRPGDVLQALCHKQFDRGPNHHSPIRDCTCGIYAYSDPYQAAMDWATSDCSTGHTDCPVCDERASRLVIAGRIEAWGRVVPGTEGFRAQYARISAIFQSPLAERVAEIYGVPVLSQEEYLKLPLGGYDPNGEQTLHCPPAPRVYYS